MLRFGVKLPAAGNYADFNSAIVGLVLGDKEIEGRASFRFLHTQSFRDLIERGRLVCCVNDGFQCGLNFLWRHGQRYCSSICDMASGPAKTASNILCLRKQMSEKSSDCTSNTACMRTISRTASKATIIALRVAQVSKKSINEMGSSFEAKRWRSRSIICAMVTVSWCSSNFLTSFLRSRICWKVFTRSTSETTNSPWTSSPVYSVRSGCDQT